MKSVILIAGGTGNLGGRIIRELKNSDTEVRAVVRLSTEEDKVTGLEQLGVKVIRVDMKDVSGITKACEGVSCVISTLAGLRDAIVDTQTCLLNAAVAAGVKRFIPSDFCSDYTALPVGENRNFDLRREFKALSNQYI